MTRSRISHRASSIYKQLSSLTLLKQLVEVVCRVVWQVVLVSNLVELSQGISLVHLVCMVVVLRLFRERFR